MTRELRELFKAGRRSLIVGFAILSFCLVLSWWLAGRDANGTAARIVHTDRAGECRDPGLGCDLEAVRHFPVWLAAACSAPEVAAPAFQRDRDRRDARAMATGAKVLAMRKADMPGGHGLAAIMRHAV